MQQSAVLVLFLLIRGMAFPFRDRCSRMKNCASCVEITCNWVVFAHDEGCFPRDMVKALDYETVYKSSVRCVELEQMIAKTTEKGEHDATVFD